MVFGEVLACTSEFSISFNNLRDGSSNHFPFIQNYLTLITMYLFISSLGACVQACCNHCWKELVFIDTILQIYHRYDVSMMFRSLYSVKFTNYVIFDILMLKSLII